MSATILPTHGPAGLQWLDGTDSGLRTAATAFQGRDAWAAGVVVQDPAGAIIAANAAAERLLGLSWDQMIGVTSTDPRWQAVSENGIALPGDRHPAIVALRTGEPVVAALMGILVPPHGDTVWLEVSADPLAVDGRLVGVVARFRDVSDTPRGRTAFHALIAAFRLLAENSSDVVFRADLAGRCEWVSPSVEKLTGWQPIALVGLSVTELVHPDDLATVLSHRSRLIAGEDEQRLPVRLRQRDDSYRWYTAVARLERDLQGAPRSSVVSLRDVDAEVRARTELAASERHYRLLAENSADVIMHMRDRVVAWVSPGVRESLGWTASELIGRSMETLVHPDDASEIEAGTLDLRAGRDVRHTMRWLRPDGSSAWFDVAARYFVEDGVPDGAVLRLRDVHDEVESRSLLEYQARHDQLTGLVNRQELADRLGAVLSGTAGSARVARGVAVAFCDVDRFKSVNDTYGHEGGDRLLQAIATRISAAVRSGDVVARLGGDEIVVVLDGVDDIEHAVAVAEKIREAVAQPLHLGESAVDASVSIGVSLARPGDDVDAIVRRADDAVYLAKERGRNCVATLDQRQL